MNFDAIDRAMIKLKHEKLKAKISWKATNELARTQQARLKRLQKQKRFLKEREQRMFNKNLFNVKELKRLKNLKKIVEIQSSIFAINFLKEFFDFNDFFLETLKWLDFFKIVLMFFDNF